MRVRAVHLPDVQRHAGAPGQAEEEFLNRYKGLADALLDNPKIMGLCYTQLYDIEQEVNGLYTYDRKECKVDKEVMLEIAEKLKI